ncbi:hypothetical protein GWN26_12890, partial [Candidatus Saccharibacteria bacterium]|nr:hypothetical protein [Candidatus Saccharibacteria bacterium]
MIVLKASFFSVLSFEVTEQAVKGFLIGVVIFPIDEIANVSRVSDKPGPTAFYRHHRFIKSNR